MIKWLIEFWRKRQRAIDREILWPQISDQAPNRTTAEHVFVLHMVKDPAYKGWLIEDMREYASELP